MCVSPCGFGLRMLRLPRDSLVSMESCRLSVPSVFSGLGLSSCRGSVFSLMDLYPPMIVIQRV